VALCGASANDVRHFVNGDQGILINSPKCELQRTTNDGANVNIEATVVADQDIFEEIGRRLAAMLAEKGILLNSRNRSR